ncbi:MAG: hypothetical protein WC182_03995 [Bacilli bacterium]
MNKKHIEIIIRISLLMIAVCLIGLFAAFIVKANIGGDAVLVFEQGFAAITKMKLGIAILVINVLLTIVVFFVDRKKINVGTVIIAFLLGPFLQIILEMGWIYDPNGNIGISILIDFFAIIGLAGALSIYIYANIGYSPFEAIVITIHERTGWRFAYIKMTHDGLLFLIGWLLGGIVGFGSLMTIVMLGPLIDLFIHLLEKTKWLPSIKKV